MIAGPALGGMLGGISAHAPFIAAALLNGFAFLLACIFLKETHHSHGGMESRFASNHSFCYGWMMHCAG